MEVTRLISKKIALMLSAFVMVLTLTFGTGVVTVYAADAQSIINQYGPQERNGSWVDPSLQNYFSTTKRNRDDVKVTGKDGKSYYYSKSNEENIKSAYATAKGNSSIKGLNDTTNGGNLNADTGGASQLLSGFYQPLQLALGVIVIILTLGLTFFTGTDLCYIVFPMFRGKMDDAKASGTKGLTKTGKDGETKLTIVSEDAQYSMVAADTIQTGKSPLFIYFKKRIFTFVALSILIYILLTGNVNVFVNIGIDLASGILKAINGVAGN